MGIKQDRPRVRTAYDLEQKYNFGAQLELMKEMRKAISKAEQSLSNLKSGEITTTTSIFLEPGAEEVETIKKHLNKVESIPSNRLFLYKFNNGSTLTEEDLNLATQASQGLISLSNWSGASKSNVTITVNLSSIETLIKVTGTNMWGRDVEYNIGDYIVWVLKDIEANKIKIEKLKNEVEADAKSLSDLSTELKTSLALASATINSDISSIKKDVSGLKTDVSGLETDVGKIADYITARGTSGSWTYEKWNSGKYVCYAKKSVTVNCSTAWGGVYHSDKIELPSFPSGTFIEKPQVFLDWNGNNASGSVYGAYNTTKTSCGDALVIRGSTGSVSGTISIMAIGKWK